MLLAAAGSKGPKLDTQILSRRQKQISQSQFQSSLSCRPLFLTNATIRPKHKVSATFDIIEIMQNREKLTTTPPACSVSPGRRARGVQPVQHAREREAAVRGVIRGQRAAARRRVARMPHLRLELARQPDEV